jgi:hypothetical protein
MLTEAQWNKINRHACLQIEDASEMFFGHVNQMAMGEIGSSVMGRTKESLSCVIRDIWLHRLEHWLRLVIDSYWKALSSLQFELNPEILAKILENGILPAVREYKRTCESKWNAHERFLPIPFPYGDAFDAHADKLIRRIRRKLDILSLELAGVLKEQLDLELDEINPRIWFKKKWHRLTSREHEMLKVLFKAAGAWVGGKEIGSRPDRLRNSMPKCIASLIETDNHLGYRIPLLLK